MSDHNQKDKQQRIHVKGSDKNKHQRKLYPEVQQNREERPHKILGGLATAFKIGSFISTPLSDLNLFFYNKKNLIFMQ